MTTAAQASLTQAWTSEIKQWVDKLAVVETIGSTNSYILNEVVPSRTQASICLAAEQTAGRGRRERAWVSQPNAGVYLSLGCAFRADQCTGLSLAVGVMMLRALQAYSVPNLQLKWPNDVLLNGKKCGGILIESRQPADWQADSLRWVVMGVGINLLEPLLSDASNALPATGLASVMPNIATQRLAIASSMVQQLYCGIHEFRQTGWLGFQEAWQSVDALRDQAIWVHPVQGEPYAASAKGVDDSGALCVQTDANTLSLHAGEVSVRMAPRL